jgi:hypothetical protein
MSVNIKDGVVGYFDILGYKNFLENNEEITKPVMDVVDRFSECTDDIKLFFQNKFQNPPNEVKLIEDVINDLGWQILSDTIIVYPKTKREVPIDQAYSIWVFCVYCSVLMRHMFKFGFPLRGVISNGDFYFKDGAIAGRPIVRAYELVQELDIAACILENNVVNKLIEAKILDEVLLIKYPIPSKSKKPENYYTLNYLSMKTEEYPQINLNFRQSILESFCKHNKSISPSVDSKINNTEYFFQFIKNKFSKHFELLEQDKKQ